jgi:hypothetical protein
MTGLRLMSLDWDRKERVTPAKNVHGLSNHRDRALRPSPRKRVLELSGGVRSLPQAPWWNADRRARDASREPRPYGAEEGPNAPAGVPLPFCLLSMIKPKPVPPPT